MAPSGHERRLYLAKNQSELFQPSKNLVDGLSENQSVLNNYSLSADIKVHMEGERLWMNAQTAPLVDVLQAVADAAKFELIAVGGLSISTTIGFHGVNLEDAINTLTENWSKIIIRTNTGPENWRPVRVWVFGVPGLTDTGQEGIPADKAESATVLPRPVLAELPVELVDTDPDIRIAGIQQLYGFRQERAVHELGEILDGDRDASVRAGAINALIKIGGETAFLAVTAGLGDEQASVRRLVLQALVALEPTQAIQYLGQAVLGDTDPVVRLKAVELLSQTSHPAAQAFLNSATDDSDENVKRVASAVLKTTTSDATIAPVELE